MTGALIATVMFIVIIYRVILRPCRCLGVIFGVQALATISYSAAQFLADSNALKIGTAVIVAVACSSSFLKRGVPVKKPSTYSLGWVYVLLGYALISTIWHPKPSDALSVWYGAAPYLLIFMVGSWSTIFNEDDFAEGLKEFYIITFPLLTWSLVFGSWGARGLESLNLQHTGHAGEAGNVMGSLALSSAAGMCCLASHIAFKKKSRLNSVLIFGTYAIMFTLIARSGSRGQLIAIIMAALIMVSLHKPLLGHVFNLILVAIVSWVVITVVPPLILSEEHLWLLDRWDVSYMVKGMEDRGTHVGLLWPHYKDAGFIGQFFGLANGYSYLPSAGGIYPHNVPFEVLCEEGILGLLIYSFMVCRTGWLLYLVSARNKLSISASVPLALFIFLSLVTLKSGSLISHYSLLVLYVVGSRIYGGSTRAGSIESSMAGRIDAGARSAI